MAQETANVGELLSVAIQAAQKGGEIIRSVWKSGKLDIKDKGNDDPFTVADVQSQQLIMGLFRKKWPNLPMVGEEDCEVPPVSQEPDVSLIDQSKVPQHFKNVPVQDVCVLVDPLDATKEYTLGNLPAVCCLIGIAVKGEAVAGVIYQPFVEVNGSGKLVYGLVGMGVVGVNPPKEPNKKLTVAVTRTHGTPELDEILRKLKADEVIRTGGAGYKQLLVLDGTADIYFHIASGTKKWDSAAGEGILRACGGSLTDLNGNKLPYSTSAPRNNAEGLICSLHNHEKHIQLILKAEEGLPGHGSTEKKQ